MFTFVRELDGLNSVREVGDRWIREAKALGIARASYHMTPAFASQVGPRTLIQQFGFPGEVIELYSDKNFRANDPIPDLVMQMARPTVWKDVVKGRRLTAEQRAFLAIAEQKGVTDGYAIPLYGPNGRDSYSSFDFGRPIQPTDERLVQTLIGTGQIAHLRVCVLVRQQFMNHAKLSQRERDVLQWIAHSKSNNDIATIMNLSPATVDTYLRRIFTKLKAVNRLTAVAAGLRLGLIQL